MYLETKFLKAVRLTNLFSILLLVVSLSISFSSFQRIAFLIALVSYVTELILEKKWLTFKWENSAQQWFFVGIITYFFMQFFFLPFEKNTSYFQSVFEQRLPFLAFGIVGLLGLNKYFELKYFAWTFITTSVVLGLFLLSKLNAEMFQNEYRSDLLALIRIKYISSHMKFNYFLNISLVYIYYLVAVYKIRKNFWTISALLTSFIVIIINLFLSDGRIGLISGLIIISVFILRYFWLRSIRLTITSLIVFFVFVALLVQQNPRLTLTRIKEDPRKEIWKVAAHEIKKSNFAGVGASTASYNLALEFSNRKMENFKHSHNIFLQTLLEYGVIGFLLILSIFMITFFTVSQKYSIIIFVFTFITILQLLVGTFQMDLNPMVFLIAIVLIIHQSKINTDTERTLHVDYQDRIH